MTYRMIASLKKSNEVQHILFSFCIIPKHILRDCFLPLRWKKSTRVVNACHFPRRFAAGFGRGTLQGLARFTPRSPSHVLMDSAFRKLPNSSGDGFSSLDVFRSSSNLSEEGGGTSFL
ncbi:hypothetical protein CEXT_747231 [Caerostris extrusa]|uniref:Uncharacterized protein n=1 Tax=Caerostris extrusa TaxID=172846 RepID=A0AAV4XMN0_CAEEX|nr:hypothetical protein CEXT_747231 [Caerostris extrusa]